MVGGGREGGAEYSPPCDASTYTLARTHTHTHTHTHAHTQESLASYLVHSPINTEHNSHNSHNLQHTQHLSYYHTQEPPATYPQGLRILLPEVLNACTNCSASKNAFSSSKYSK